LYNLPVRLGIHELQHILSWLKNCVGYLDRGS
jgi:hypothetical protein